ncbi:hypothetical protein [Runella limosa]|uniref:hypothetical protein n=1 Tax=Runella limosa TaxID=370978 RepID=UPI0012F8258C|nr:hypothetical protein [Runella limosa]
MKRKHHTTEPDFVVVPNQPLSDVERRKLSSIIKGLRTLHTPTAIDEKSLLSKQSST